MQEGGCFFKETQLIIFWIPAFAGVTPIFQYVIPVKAGIQNPWADLGEKKDFKLSLI